MPEISSGYKTSSSDELRLKNYRNMIEQKHEIELRDMEARNAEETQKVTDHHREQLSQLRGAYDVQISEEAEALEARLHDLRLNNLERVGTEKRAAEIEIDKIKANSHAQIDETKKNADIQIEALHKQLQTSTEVLHDQARKTARREREA